MTDFTCIFLLDKCVVRQPIQIGNFSIKTTNVRAAVSVKIFSIETRQFIKVQCYTYGEFRMSHINLIVYDETYHNTL